MNHHSSRPYRILVTRTDRLGDVILATPVLRELRKAYPAAQISFLVQKSWMPILQFGDAVELLEYRPDENARALSERLSAKKYHQVIVLRDEKKVTSAVRKASIPARIGPYSSLRSFYSFNRGKFQKRSACKMHEAEYNLDLIWPRRPAQSIDQLPRAWIETSDQAKIRAAEFLQVSGLPQKNFVVIHPGSSGSARYVNSRELHHLAKMCLANGLRVCVSGGPLEEDALAEFQNSVPGAVLLGQAAGLGLDGMAEVYRAAGAVVAHGTGPLHLAAAVGTPTLAIFPPIFVLGENRWGPLVSPRSVWTPPEVNCPATYRCLGARCEYFDCMDRFSVRNAFEQILELRRSS